MIFLCKMGLESGMVEVGRCFYSSNLLCQDGEPTRMCIEAAKKQQEYVLNPKQMGIWPRRRLGMGQNYYISIFWRNNYPAVPAMT